MWAFVTHSFDAYPAPRDGDAQDEDGREKKKKKKGKKKGKERKKKERAAVGRAATKQLAKAVPGAAEWGQVIPSASHFSQMAL